MTLIIKPPSYPSSSTKTSKGNATDCPQEQDLCGSRAAPPATPSSPANVLIERRDPNTRQHMSIVDQGDRMLSNTVKQPPLTSRPFSEADSVDALALKAAIASLQIQRKTAQEHIIVLSTLKDRAISRPNEFRDHVIKSIQKSQPISQSIIKQAFNDDDTSEVQSRQETLHEFDNIPRPQNVVRCPPIEWAKYHIVGESLEKMHNFQQATSEVASPYNPFRDTINSAMTNQTIIEESRNDLRKDSVASSDELRKSTNGSNENMIYRTC